MLTFNQLLQRGGLDPANVRLVRHKPGHDHHRAVFDAAMKSDPRFREYQERQGKEQIITQFRAAEQLAGFVVDPTTKQTVFMARAEVYVLAGTSPQISKASDLGAVAQNAFNYSMPPLSVSILLPKP